MDWSTFLRILHIIGTVLGVGAATFLEIFSIYFAKDGKVDIFEHEILRIFVAILRFGLVILTFSGFGLLVLWRLRLMGPETFYGPKFMAKMTIILILLSVAFLMNFRLINLKVGSAISTASWYAAMIFGIWRRAEFSYFVLMGFYLVFVLLTYFSLEFIRSRVIKTNE